MGTFYVAPGPDAPPYVTEGSRVEKGQVVCIVEAMKLMNEIEADVSGVVTLRGARERRPSRVRRASLRHSDLSGIQRVSASARPFRRILVANRGEIAVRIIRACRDLDIATVAVFSTADRDALHVRLADAAICVGPPAPAGSYLHQRNLLSAAHLAGAEAVHPGYGFLAENADFATAVEQCGLTWIGPAPSSIRTLGDKSGGREAAAAAGVPVLEGGPLPEQSAEAAEFADGIGYPLMLKAAAGGGGRGMRVVRDRAGLRTALQSAAKEAVAAFGNGELIVERLLERPRHIEVQVFGDSFGRAVQLGERDCSIQRRHQKLLEEAPAPRLGADLRRSLGEAALRLAKRVGYANAGTVEFLVDGARFYFLEMNTPHPGRASGDRGGDRGRPGQAPDRRRRRRASGTSGWNRNLGSRDRVPRQRRRSRDVRALARHAAALPAAPPAPAFGSTATVSKAPRCRRTTTPCSPRWSRTAGTAPRRYRGWPGPSGSSRSTASTPPSR